MFYNSETIPAVAANTVKCNGGRSKKVWDVVDLLKQPYSAYHEGDEPYLLGRATTLIKAIEMAERKCGIRK